MATRCVGSESSLAGCRLSRICVQARFGLHIQVYYHKKNTAINSMLTELAREARKAKLRLFPGDRSKPPAEPLRAIVEQHVEPSDDQFLSSLASRDVRHRRLSPRIPTTDVDAALLAGALALLHGSSGLSSRG